MDTTILYSKNFELFKQSGVGTNDTPWTKLEVRSVGIAKKHVVEIRLNSDYPEFNGQPVQYKYSGRAYVSHGMRMVQDTLEETLEYAEVLKEAVNFAKAIQQWLDKHPEWKIA